MNALFLFQIFFHTYSQQLRFMYHINSPNYSSEHRIFVQKDIRSNKNPQKRSLIVENNMFKQQGCLQRPRKLYESKGNHELDEIVGDRQCERDIQDAQWLKIFLKKQIQIKKNVNKQNTSHSIIVDSQKVNLDGKKQQNISLHVFMALALSSPLFNKVCKKKIMRDLWGLFLKVFEKKDNKQNQPQLSYFSDKKNRKKQINKEQFPQKNIQQEYIDKQKLQKQKISKNKLQNTATLLKLFDQGPDYQDILDTIIYQEKFYGLLDKIYLKKEDKNNILVEESSQSILHGNLQKMGQIFNMNLRKVELRTQDIYILKPNIYFNDMENQQLWVQQYSNGVSEYCITKYKNTDSFKNCASLKPNQYEKLYKNGYITKNIQMEISQKVSSQGKRKKVSSAGKRKSAKIQKSAGQEAKNIVGSSVYEEEEISEEELKVGSKDMKQRSIYLKPKKLEYRQKSSKKSQSWQEQKDKSINSQDIDHEESSLMISQSYQDEDEDEKQYKYCQLCHHYYEEYSQWNSHDYSYQSYEGSQQSQGYQQSLSDQAWDQNQSHQSQVNGHQGKNIIASDVQEQKRSLLNANLQLDPSVHLYQPIQEKKKKGRAEQHKNKRKQSEKQKKMTKKQCYKHKYVEQYQSDKNCTKKKQRDQIIDNTRSVTPEVFKKKHGQKEEQINEENGQQLISKSVGYKNAPLFLNFLFPQKISQKLQILKLMRNVRKSSKGKKRNERKFLQPQKEQDYDMCMKKVHCRNPYLSLTNPIEEVQQEEIEQEQIIYPKVEMKKKFDDSNEKSKKKQQISLQVRIYSRKKNKIKNKIKKNVKETCSVEKVEFLHNNSLHFIPNESGFNIGWGSL